MARGQLIAVHVAPDDPFNRLWAIEHRVRPAWRWTVRVRASNGYGIHPVLSFQMFRTYSAARRAIELSSDMS